MKRMEFWADSREQDVWNEDTLGLDFETFRVLTTMDLDVDCDVLFMLSKNTFLYSNMTFKYLVIVGHAFWDYIGIENETWSATSPPGQDVISKLMICSRSRPASWFFAFKYWYYLCLDTDCFKACTTERWVWDLLSNTSMVWFQQCGARRWVSDRHVHLDQFGWQSNEQL